MSARDVNERWKDRQYRSSSSRKVVSGTTAALRPSPPMATEKDFPLMVVSKPRFHPSAPSRMAMTFEPDVVPCTIARQATTPTVMPTAITSEAARASIGERIRRDIRDSVNRAAPPAEAERFTAGRSKLRIFPGTGRRSCGSNAW